MVYENFISYRRSETSLEVKNLYDALKERGFSTFCDIYSLGSGKFTDDIKNAIDNCTNFLLVLGSHSLERCTSKQDWLYKEISEALNKGKNIICVFTEKFDFPDLPDEIDSIKSHNGVFFDIFYFDAFIDKLVSKFLVTENTKTESDDTRDFLIQDGILVKYVGNAQIVKIPNRVTSIGKYAFKDKTRIVKLLFSDNIEAIDEGAFERCIFITHVTLPVSLKRLGKRSFSRCYNLAYVEFGNMLEQIDEKCFSFCERLKYLQLPSSLKNIHPSAFNNCSQLMELHVDPSNEHYTSSSGILYDKNMQQVIKCPENIAQDMIDLPETVKTIGPWSFSKCMKLVSLSFPKALENVMAYAFKDSCNIRSIQLFDQLKEFDTTALDGWNEDQNVIMGKRFHPILKYNIDKKLQDIRNRRNANDEEKFCLIKTAFESEQEAKKMASMLLDKKLIVSGQIKQMDSMYMWDEELCSEREFELTCFTESSLYNEVEMFINEHHSYELCEIICLPISNISKEFGHWISNYIKC